MLAIIDFGRQNSQPHLTTLCTSEGCVGQLITGWQPRGRQDPINLPNDVGNKMNCCGRRATFHRQPPHSTPTFCAPDAEFISPPPHIVCLFWLKDIGTFGREVQWKWRFFAVFLNLSSVVCEEGRISAGRRGRGNIYDDRRGPEPDGRGGTQGRGQTCAPPACRRRHAPASLSLSLSAEKVST